MDLWGFLLSEGTVFASVHLLCFDGIMLSAGLEQMTGMDRHLVAETERDVPGGNYPAAPVLIYVSYSGAI